MGSVFTIPRTVFFAIFVLSYASAWMHSPGFQLVSQRDPMLSSAIKFFPRVVTCGSSTKERLRLNHLRMETSVQSKGDTPIRLFIFGLGYTGIALARAAHESMEGACAVSGTYRSQNTENWENCGISAFYFDSSEDGEMLSDAGRQSLRAATHVVSTMPPDRKSGIDPVLELCGEELKRAGLWAGYLSTTSVYGDHQGAWVDETSPTLVSPTDSAARRLDAEQAWLGLGEHGVEAHVFRLSGIYGPGRSMIDTLRKKGASGRGAVGGESKFVSRIHVDDICKVVLASMRNASGGSIYNVADDRPAPRAEVEEFAIQLLRNNSEDVKQEEEEKVKTDDDGVVVTGSAAGTGVNGAEDAGRSARRGSARSRRTDNKRVSNRKIREELGVELQYPDYAIGLRAVLYQSSESKPVDSDSEGSRQR